MPTPIRIVDGPIATDELGRPVAALPIRYVEDPIATNEAGQPIDALHGEIVDSAVVTTAGGQVVGSLPVRVVSGLVALNEVGNPVAVLPVWLGGDIPPPDPDPVFARTASTNETRTVHPGHSLTDAYAHAGPHPSTLKNIVASIGITDAENKHMLATIPGSPMSWRWARDNDIAEGSRPVADAGLFHTLMITEAGPPPHLANGADSVAIEWTFDYWCRFAANQIENGAGNDVILWSIWPDLRGPGATDENPTPTGDWAGYTFRTGLPQYGHSFKFMADYATDKMKLLYPPGTEGGVPSDWRVWIVPGHKWMERVYDDVQLGLVPGVTDIAELFTDNIHTTPIAGYGLSCLVTTVQYQRNLTTADNVWVMPAYTDHNGVDWPAVTQAQAEYFWQIAWEIATDYEPAGMGGSNGAEAAWTLAEHGDFMPNWTLADPSTDPEPEVPGEGEIPADALGIVTPTAVTGLTFTPVLPEAVGGVRPITAMHSAPAGGAVYFAIRSSRAADLHPTMAALAAGANDWNFPQIGVRASQWFPDFRAFFDPGGASPGTGVPLDTAVHTMECWYEEGTLHVSIDGGAVVSEGVEAGAAFSHILLSIYGVAFDLVGLVAMPRVPNDTERANIRAALEAPA